MAELEGLVARLDSLSGALNKIAQKAAPRIEADLIAHARTKRGNVPSYGEKGNVPIRAEAVGPAVVVLAPDWVLQKAIERGQVIGWVAIAEESARDVLKGG